MKVVWRKKDELTWASECGRAVIRWEPILEDCEHHEWHAYVDGKRRVGYPSLRRCKKVATAMLTRRPNEKALRAKHPVTGQTGRWMDTDKGRVFIEDEEPEGSRK